MISGDDDGGDDMGLCKSLAMSTFLPHTSIPISAECICHAIHPNSSNLVVQIAVVVSGPSAMPMKYYDSVRITIEMCLRAAVMGV